jgi:hypothetical protein
MIDAHRRRASLTGWLVTIVVVAVLVAALLIVGSPMEARREAADRERASDLNSLSWRLESYFTRNKSLPSDLKKLESQEYYVDPFHDPVTGRPYEYRTLDAKTYEVCANFETDTTGKGRRGMDGEFGVHAKGRVCFKRTVGTTKP